LNYFASCGNVTLLMGHLSQRLSVDICLQSLPRVSISRPTYYGSLLRSNHINCDRSGHPSSVWLPLRTPGPEDVTPNGLTNDLISAEFGKCRLFLQSPEWTVAEHDALRFGGSTRGKEHFPM